MSNTAHPIITHQNAPDFVGLTFKTEKNFLNRDTISVMAYGKNYFMLRFKGAQPFVKSINEVNRYLMSGEWVAPKLKSK